MDSAQVSSRMSLGRGPGAARAPSFWGRRGLSGWRSRDGSSSAVGSPHPRSLPRAWRLPSSPGESSVPPAASSCAVLFYPPNWDFLDLHTGALISYGKLEAIASFPGGSMVFVKPCGSPTSRPPVPRLFGLWSGLPTCLISAWYSVIPPQKF